MYVHCPVYYVQTTEKYIGTNFLSLSQETHKPVFSGVGEHCITFTAVLFRFTVSSRDEDTLRRKVAEQLVTIERLERDRKERNEKLAEVEASSKKYGKLYKMKASEVRKGAGGATFESIM